MFAKEYFENVLEGVQAQRELIHRLLAETTLTSKELDDVTEALRLLDIVERNCQRGLAMLP